MITPHRSRNHATLAAVLVGSFSVVAATSARAADPAATGDVLRKLHKSHQKEIQMGKVAQKNGQSKEVTDFGKMLVKDHTAAEKKVLALAKHEKIDLQSGGSPASHDMTGMAKEPDFDAHFAKDMLDDHKKDIAEATSARDSTTDDRLKKRPGKETVESWPNASS